MTYQIWTIQLGRWRLARDLGIHMLDITAKSGIRAFAPDYAKVMEYKAGEVSEEEYTRLYLARMEESRERFPRRWEQLKEFEKVALACYCRAGVFCHRLIFRDLMKDYLEEAGHEVVLTGEVLPKGVFGDPPKTF